MTRSFDLGPALLFCPADRPDRFAKALERADALILDLEDAVADDAKSTAREALVTADLDPARVIVRVNGAASAHHDADVAALATTDFRTVMLPKAADPADLARLADYDVIALCETAAGVLAAGALAAEANVVALMWGAEDLVVSLGGTSSRAPDGRYRDVPRQARSMIALAAAAGGAAAIDAVHVDIPDLAGLAEEAADAAALGFAATACIHPSQVETIRAAYRPTDAQVRWAAELLAAAEGAPGAFAFRGAMIDEPVLRQARAILGRRTER
ncbi:aldolase/citrate lyase family protein [Leifsonia sp. H3M29-4]|uniref:HpcH/HpaI aldolase/citrate lyase family protein n=1 Tax=Salinibacterium metalliresistens TaxID=3031321 RepID=UPI0023DCA2A5|nr:aldolase/citrate lyase family protein [Salinibacterium metalliresistens]MDF1478470.1 aldolase/citrate lyase family protein [Salinibacterium metalliresistens]